MELEEATQATQNTQGVFDPRRKGGNNSGLCEADISDVICILHPCSPAAFRVVASEAASSRNNVLQSNGFEHYDDGLTQSALEEQETFILSSEAPHQAMDLALRFSTETIQPTMGFVFGRNSAQCDIVLATDAFKRVSNCHFSIYINNAGMLMLQDMSTNGTIVDEVLLRGKTSHGPHTRMLNPGSIIQILSHRAEDLLKFIVRIPSREGFFNAYEANFQDYMHRVDVAQARAKERKEGNILDRRLTAAPMKTQNGGSVMAPLVQNQYGMHWSGGDKYNVVGMIGKGAFATVYQLATKSEGQLFAVKELEKRKFMKNGVLDRKLENELQIMRGLNHESIVQYVDYQDHSHHLYIIMEFVPCGDLQKYLKNNGSLPEPLAKRMASQVLDALAYLHKKKVTHRDIKPDNILIANVEPESFTIKLSDFGLSKVVTDNDTFLKTFCGTLLYCAPEVFPHFDEHAAGKGKKRPRKGPTAQPSKFHSYSQSVDVWSFGAVLWYSLCLEPPFEGVADANGRGMLDKIMMTPLDATNLIRHGVSDDAIALLVEMLNTDPSARPSVIACIRHRWFGFRPQLSQDADAGAIDEGLKAIAEEEVEVDDEPDVSGLSLDEQESSHNSQTSEVSIHSGSLEFLDPRESKRFKPEPQDYRDRDDLIDSSPELLHDYIQIVHQPEGGRAQAQRQPAGQRKLFGEISHSALDNSNVFGERIDGTADLSNSSRLDDSHSRADHDRAEAAQRRSRGAVASPSLLGAESLVRDLNMDSPRSSRSSRSAANGPVTPKTPALVRSGSRANGASHADDDTTPKQPQRPFNRRINIPIPASFYYDPADPSTHNPEYASKVSGHDYVNVPLYRPEVPSMPPTAAGSITDNDDEDLDGHSHVMQRSQWHDTTSPPSLSPFVKPPPRLGRLVSTSDSFASITINITSKLTIWGRLPANSHPYPDTVDTRVPKRGIFIHFEAQGMKQIADDDDARLKLPDLHCVVLTESRQELIVNGINLPKSDRDKRYYGRVYTGDEIVVWKGRDGQPGLKFICEFFHGEAKQSRTDTASRFKVQVEGQSRRSRSKSKGKEKENVDAEL